jgi:hypothetical protein
MAKGNRKPRTEQQKERMRQYNASKTPEERREQARKAIAARWGNTKKPPLNIAEIIEDACSEGATVQSICAVMSICRETWYKWRDTYPEIDAAYKRGRSVEHDRLVNKLVEVALKGNVAAICFALKTRHNYVDSGVGAAIENKVQINFQLPGALKPEEYLKTLTATAEIIPPATAEKALAKPGVKRAVIRQLTRGDGKEPKTDANGSL